MRLERERRMEWALRLEQLLRLAEAAGIEVRAEAMGGQGGGLCRLKGHRVLFVDTTADAATRYDVALSALADVLTLDDHFVPPVVRADLERCRARRGGPSHPRATECG